MKRERFHASKDQQGWNFGQAFPKFRETYLNPFTRFLKSAFSPDVRAAHVLGGNTTIAEKQNGGVEGMGEMDDEAHPAEQEQSVEGKELSQTEDGQIEVQTNGVQTNEGPANAKSNDGGDHQKDPEMEANPEDNNPMPRSPRAPTPVPSSPPASPTNSRGLSQAPALPRMNGIDSNPAEKNLQDNIVNANKASDQVITQVDGPIAPELNTVKRPRPHPLAKVTPVEDSLVTTRGKRLRSGPAPKEILTLAERARQMDGGRGDEALMTPRANRKGEKGNLSKRGRGRKSVSA